MEQMVRVKEAYPDGTALVIHVRESACSGDCHKCSGCGAAKEAVLFTADNPIGARRGDLVKVESDTGTVLKAAVVNLKKREGTYVYLWLIHVDVWQKPT